MLKTNYLSIATLANRVLVAMSPPTAGNDVNEGGQSERRVINEYKSRTRFQRRKAPPKATLAIARAALRKGT